MTPKRPISEYAMSSILVVSLLEAHDIFLATLEPDCSPPFNVFMSTPVMLEISSVKEASLKGSSEKALETGALTPNGVHSLEKNLTFLGAMSS